MKNFKRFLVVIMVIALIIAIFIIVIQNQKREEPPAGPLKFLVPPEEPAVITPDPVAIVKEINKLARLETVSMTFQQVIKGEKGDPEVLWGACLDKITFMAYGEVIAGVDFERLVLDNINIVAPDHIQIQLPEAEIFTAALDNNQSEIVERTTGFLTYPDTDLETEVRQKAQDELLVKAYEADIINIATENAKNTLTEFLKNLGFTNVEFIKFEKLNLLPSDK